MENNNYMVKERKMFTVNEIQYMYQVFDSLQVPGIQQKQMVITIMQKLTQILQEAEAQARAQQIPEQEEE